MTLQNPTGNTVPLKNILGTIIGKTLVMLQNPTGNTVPLKNILGTNNWRNTRDASKSNRQYCTAQKYFSQHNSRNTLEASNPTGNTVPLKNILGTNTLHLCTFQKSLLMSLVLLVNLFVMSPQTCKLFIHFVAR